MIRIAAISQFVLAALLSAGPGAARAALQETPFFEQAVASGKLPTVEDRVPSDPALADDGR